MNPDLNPCPVCRIRQPYTPLVCGPCRHRLPLQLREISILWPVLPAALETAPVAVLDLTLRARGGASTNSVGDPYGDQTGQLPVAAVFDSWTTAWAETLGQLDQLPVPTVFRLGQWLFGHLEWACEDPRAAVGDFATEIRALLAACRRALNRDLSPTRYAARCPYGCDGQTLSRHPGADWIECGSCRRLWSEDEYGLLARAALDPDELLSTPEAALLASSVMGRTVSPDLIRKWAQRGTLEPLYPNGSRQPWYRKAQVEEVAADRLVSLG